MFSVSQLNEIQIIAFGLILLRMNGFIFTAALFNSNSISAPVKILISVVLTMTVFHQVATSPVLVELNSLQDQLIILAIKEILVGIVIGFLSRIFFFAIMMAGEFISVTMGIGQAQIFNPMMGNMGNVMEQFFMTLSTLLYLGLNGHHYLIESLTSSFQWISIGIHQFQFQGLLDVTMMAQQFFIFGIKISAPIVFSMLIIQIGVGLLSRAVPQINVLVTTAPITVLLGFAILFISLPLMVMQMNSLLGVSFDEVFRFVKAF